MDGCDIHSGQHVRAGTAPSTHSLFQFQAHLSLDSISLTARFRWSNKKLMKEL